MLKPDYSEGMKKIDTYTALDLEEQNSEELELSGSPAYDDQKRFPGPTPTLQSHRGLGDYHEGDKVLYSTGKRFTGYAVAVFLV